MTVPVNIDEAAATLRARHISSRELLEACLERANRTQERLHLYTSRFDRQARAAADEADRDFAHGIDRGPLQGVPVGIKDIILTREGPTSGNSQVHEPSWQVRRDAAGVARLRRAGAVITGKLSTMELATGAPDPDGPFPLPRTPWDTQRWAGGSSSGSGAGVACGAFLGALGTDTGGSIRMPASYCGVTGLKPTHGRVPLDGVLPFAGSFDCVGPLTRSAVDAALMLQVIAGPGPDGTGTPPVSHLDLRLDAPLDDLTIGVAHLPGRAGEMVDAAVGAAFEAAVGELGRAGATLVDASLPHYQEAIDVSLTSIFVEGLAAHGRNLRSQWDAFQRLTRLGYASGALITAEEHVRLTEARGLIRRRLAESMEGIDAIVTPTTGTAAPRAGRSMEVARVMESVFTAYWSTTGNPTISVPMGFLDGLPLGLQIAGRHFEEPTVLRIAAAYQRRTDWHARLPPIMLEDDRVS